MKKRMTVRQKSTVQAAMKPKSVYILSMEIEVKAETVEEIQEYFFKARKAIDDLGATASVEGRVKVGFIKLDSAYLLSLGKAWHLQSQLYTKGLGKLGHMK